jgi:hypothetical protein
MAGSHRSRGKAGRNNVTRKPPQPIPARKISRFVSGMDDGTELLRSSRRAWTAVFLGSKLTCDFSHF